MESTPSGGITDPTTGIGAIPLSASSVYSNSSYTGDTGQRRATPNRRRSSPAFGAAGPNPSIRMSASTRPKSRKTVPGIARDPTTSSRYVPSDLDDLGQASISSSPNIEVVEEK